MNKIIPGSQGLAFDRGIESIVFTRDQGDMSMPERAQSAPAEGGVKPQLERLLERPTLEDALGEAIRPTQVDRGLMVPVNFRSALDTALDRLKGAADERSQATGPDAEEQLRLLNRATRLLNEEVNLRELVQMYRSALYQG